MTGRTAEIQLRFEQVYEALRHVAEGVLRREAPGHTLSPTALVHEAFLRLLSSRNAAEADRAKFMAMAATAMRRIVVEHARHKKSQRAGGRRRRVALETTHLIDPAATIDGVAVSDALERLESLDARAARVAELRVFAGCTMREIAATLGVAESTVYLDWDFARAFLRRELVGLDGEEKRRPDGAK